MADSKPQPLLEAMKIAKGTKAGLPMHIQNMIHQIATTQDAQERARWAQDVSRWLYAESAKPDLDHFAALGYSTLSNALATYLADEP